MLRRFMIILEVVAGGIVLERDDVFEMLCVIACVRSVCVW
jgi:hypothetical protein